MSGGISCDSVTIAYDGNVVLDSLDLDVLSGAPTVHFRFRRTGSDNWYWVIDGVRISHS